MVLPSPFTVIPLVTLLTREAAVDDTSVAHDLDPRGVAIRADSSKKRPSPRTSQPGAENSFAVAVISWKYSVIPLPTGNCGALRAGADIDHRMAVAERGIHEGHAASDQGEGTGVRPRHVHLLIDPAHPAPYRPARRHR